MKPFAALALAGALLATTLGSAMAWGPPPLVWNGKSIVAATNQPNREGNYDPRGYDGVWGGMPRAYYGQPAPRFTYYTDEWCRLQGDYNPHTKQVTEPNGKVWQCGKPLY